MTLSARVLASLMLLVLLATTVSCGTSAEDSGQARESGTSTTEAAPPIHTAEPAELQVVEVGSAHVYSRYPEFRWVAMVHNPNGAQAAVGLRVRATHFDADGAAVSVCDIVDPQMVAPNGTATVTGSEEQIADSVEVEVVALHWLESTGDLDVDFSGVRLVDLSEPAAKGVVGSVTNRGDSPVAGGLVAALRDDGGSLLGWARTSLLEELKPGSSEQFRIILPEYSDDAPTTAEVFLEPSVSASPPAEKTCEPDLSPDLPS